MLERFCPKSAADEYVISFVLRLQISTWKRMLSSTAKRTKYCIVKSWLGKQFFFSKQTQQFSIIYKHLHERLEKKLNSFNVIWNDLHIPLNILTLQWSKLQSTHHSQLTLSVLTQPLICTALISMMEKRPSTFILTQNPHSSTLSMSSHQPLATWINFNHFSAWT